MTKWLLQEISNVTNGKLNRSYEYGTYITRNYRLFSDFSLASIEMKKTIKKYSSKTGELFDESGSVRHIDELSNLFTKYELDVIKPGESPFGCDENTERTKDVISAIPGLLYDFFNDRPLDTNNLTEDIDSEKPILLSSFVKYSYEEIKGITVFGNFDSKFNVDNCIQAPYETPNTDEDELPPMLSINAFNMTDSSLNYHCRIVGKYIKYDDAAPFVHIELVKLDEE